MLISPPTSRIALALLKVDATHKVQHFVQYRFKDKELLWQAVQTHRSDNFPYANQPLAYVGDAVLRFALAADGDEQGLTIGKQRIYAP